MKKNHLFILNKTGGVLLIFFMMLLVSCTDGYDGNSGFSSEVTDSQLESPDASGVIVTTVTNQSTANAELKITWPVVYGAGGYSFTLYNVDDPDNPIAVGEENQFVDGCSVQRERADDTKYKIVVKTLDNIALNNTGSITATEVEYTTLIPSVATIPDGSDLADYFVQHPLEGNNSTELVYELVAGGNYTLNSSLDFGANWITLRGDKIDRPNVTYGIEGRFNITAGFKLRFIDFDCSAVPASATDAAFLSLSINPDEGILSSANNNHYIIKEEVVIESCNIKGVNRHLVYDNRKKYAVAKLRIQDCIIALNTTQVVITTNGGGGIINDLSFIENTIYGLDSASNGRFLQYGSSARPDRAGFDRGAISMYYNTLYNVSPLGQMGNYNAMNSTLVNLNLIQNLFVNTGNKEIIRRLAGGTNMVRNFSYNCYWYDGGFAAGEEMGHNQGDNAVANKAASTGFYEEPNFAGPINNIEPSNVNFTPEGSLILTNSVGDPRWLP